MTTKVQAQERAAAWPLARRAVAGLAQPGGRVMLERALTAIGLDDGDRVVEFAPGLGVTTEAILERDPRAWIGVEPDPLAAARLAKEFGAPGRDVVEAPVDATGLPDESATAVVVDALLCTLSGPARASVLTEAARLLHAGGRVAIHEFTTAPGLRPGAEAREDLASIGIDPLSEQEWRDTAEAAGLVVVGSLVGPVAMPPQRDLMRRAGPRTALKITRQVALDGPLRTAANRSHQILHRHEPAMRSIVVVAEMPLILGMRRPRR